MFHLCGFSFDKLLRFDKIVCRVGSYIYLISQTKNKSHKSIDKCWNFRTFAYIMHAISWTFKHQLKRSKTNCCCCYFFLCVVEIFEQTRKRKHTRTHTNWLNLNCTEYGISPPPYCVSKLLRIYIIHYNYDLFDIIFVNDWRAVSDFSFSHLSSCSVRIFCFAYLFWCSQLFQLTI